MSISIDINVNWEELCKQKLKLLQVSEEKDLSQEEYDAMQGIICLIDDIQDQAEAKLGKDAVLFLSEEEKVVDHREPKEIDDPNKYIIEFPDKFAITFSIDAIPKRLGYTIDLESARKIRDSAIEMHNQCMTYEGIMIELKRKFGDTLV